eukprot:scaffold648032_cov31-Prasinocladus_malaysianus.AAC.2
MAVNIRSSSDKDGRPFKFVQAGEPMTRPRGTRAEDHSDNAPSLFAFPLESNFSGQRYDMSLTNQVRFACGVTDALI